MFCNDDSNASLQVLAAFFASATLTCGITVIGYLSESLPLDSEHNEIDEVVLDRQKLVEPGEQNPDLPESWQVFLLKRKYRSLSISTEDLVRMHLTATLERDHSDKYMSYVLEKYLASGKLYNKSELLYTYRRRFDKSFLSKFPLMIFLFIHGLVQTIMLRWFYDMKASEATRRMDFGQVTALFLLLLPVLTAAAALSGKCRSIRSHFVLTTVQNQAR